MSPASGAAYVKAPSADQCDWQIRGLCSSGLYDMQLWDSRLEDEPIAHKHRREEAAKAICHFCPEIHRCAKWALDAQEQHGTWGGLTEAERRTLLGKPPLGRRQNREPVPEVSHAS